MSSLKERIEEKLDFLPETELDEVLNFVEFLIKRKSSDRSYSQESPVLAIAGNLPLDPLTSEEIETELYEQNIQHNNPKNHTSQLSPQWKKWLAEVEKLEVVSDRAQSVVD
ncbi:MULTISPECIES: hypothetical protein [Spirulina sp. CCY15215]|uniref:DUF2281 domain-containing protein n=1 Tax=Spirulina sp. CCY15215 TaxID=2767591 RepID=UPI00194FA32E|nr:hypothetical protein [Spirulina major]